jgi:hypothetical protein
LTVEVPILTTIVRADASAHGPDVGIQRTGRNPDPFGQAQRAVASGAVRPVRRAGIQSQSSTQPGAAAATAGAVRLAWRILAQYHFEA